MSELDREIRTYEAKLEELLANEGQFVVIHGDEIVGIFAAYEDALRGGYEKVGIDPFLVKQIESVDQICQFTRDILG